MLFPLPSGQMEAGEASATYLGTMRLVIMPQKVEFVFHLLVMNGKFIEFFTCDGNWLFELSRQGK